MVTGKLYALYMPCPNPCLNKGKQIGAQPVLCPFRNIPVVSLFLSMLVFVFLDLNGKPHSYKWENTNSNGLG